MLFDRPLFAANSSNSSPDRGMKEEGWRWKTTATQTLGRREKEEEAGDNKQRSSRMRLSHLPSSRIFRVSRASGGKDRHSKVYTSKGLRDRRIRLSVSTAIQFYDLQDRLGYDQPSKAIEWLIQAAAASIAELPSLEYSFSDDMPLAIEGGGEPSTSETSKGSVLSLSRSAIGVVKDDDDDDDKERDEEDDHNVVEEVSFTKLLTGGSSNSNSNGNGDYIPSGFSSQMEMQQFGLFQEHYYSISPTLSGFHRGTLQSNSPSHHHHHHQEPFFFSAVANTAAASPTENPYVAGFDGHLQLCEGYEQLKLKGKGRS